jgi:hypothetical protein
MTTGVSTEIYMSEMLKPSSSFSNIEEFIERQPLPEEERAVRWRLRMWSERPDESLTTSIPRRRDR